MRFNPPPNWPPPPSPDWTPPAGWLPDPAWGEPPYGWQLWVDGAPAPAVPAAAPVESVGQMWLDAGGVFHYGTQAAPAASVKGKISSRMVTVSSRVTATRLVVGGPFALAAKKKQKEKVYFLKISGAINAEQELHGGSEIRAAGRLRRKLG